MSIWPWQVVRENLLLAFWPLVILAVAFALPAAAVVAAACLASSRRATLLALGCALAVCGLQIGFVADWLIAELHYADWLSAFTRDNPGTIVDRFDDGPRGTAIMATLRAATYSLVLALAALLVQGMVRVLKRMGAVRTA